VKYSPIVRDFFTAQPRTGADKFAATFVAKADLLKLWPVNGFVKGDKVLAAISLRVTTREPIVANLQLLHTFAAYRRQGFASELVMQAYGRIPHDVKYFRVSSEHDAVEFYRSLGLKFWGKQKSGSFLCIHRITSADPGTGLYDAEDPVIKGLLFSGRRGSLVERFAQPE
jgi:GNAT superfamily N-acetyltransferase